MINDSGRPLAAVTAEDRYRKNARRKQLQARKPHMKTDGDGAIILKVRGRPHGSPLIPHAPTCKSKLINGNSKQAGLWVLD